ncbi:MULTISPECIES: tetratricopeptide repeat protein [Limnospira]|uniref:tetratricopeptide repeat protein n=1 Tax=Limnospira TaxID=2596745 RepID=UPI0002803D5E|nr:MULTISPECIES: tetratricopeptide repeat protein [Limnospira]EKD07091.1 TPR repeat-containing protein [Arthrospira platensis C1]QJB26078.1 tetratricopeptide repeat protein [Limnospira fusiformis SAG 85.79]MDT9187917.1 tetratricopeptide repeat protein [Limnospira sp. PMC 894.15]MDT9233802.1 tetratricopeptide repeat protein [Limnospira sp. PMC 917.15]MDT9275292.1 tetratricopeptide repeat protein [Limnospira sp. PMC 737.11]
MKAVGISTAHREGDVRRVKPAVAVLPENPPFSKQGSMSRYDGKKLIGEGDEIMINLTRVLAMGLIAGLVLPGLTASASEILSIRLPRLVAQENPQDQANQLFQEAIFLTKQGTPSALREAIAKFKEVMPLLDQIGDSFAIAATMTAIGSAYSELGENQPALDYLNQALSMWDIIDSPEEQRLPPGFGKANTLQSIGQVHLSMEETTTALDYYQQALSIFDEIGEPYRKVNILNEIGEVYVNLGEISGGLEYYQRALSISQSVGYLSGEAQTLNNIGLAHLALGDRQQALDYLNQAFSLWQSMGDRQREAETQENIDKSTGIE